MSDKVIVKELTFALVGAGEFGNFAQSVLDQVPEVRLAAVVDTNEAAATTLAQKHNVPIYADLEQAFKNHKLDFVMINTPNDTHYAIAKTALQHGAGVFCEKPFTIHAEETKELFALARPGQIDVDMVLRESLGYKYLQDKIKLLPGLPKSIYIENRATESQLKADWYWDDNRSGGWFYTSAIHFLDIVFYLYPEFKVSKYKAKLNIDQITKRPRGYECTLVAPDTEFTIVHYFDTDDEHVGVDAIFAYDQVKASVKGWVPTEITWTNAEIEPFKLKVDRETEYRQMVSRRLRAFCIGLVVGQNVLDQKELVDIGHWCERLNVAAHDEPDQWISV